MSKFKILETVKFVMDGKEHEGVIMRLSTMRLYVRYVDEKGNFKFVYVNTNQIKNLEDE